MFFVMDMRLFTMVLLRTLKGAFQNMFALERNLLVVLSRDHAPVNLLAGMKLKPLQDMSVTRDGNQGTTSKDE